jgi:hypothetical protein
MRLRPFAIGPHTIHRSYPVPPLLSGVISSPGLGVCAAGQSIPCAAGDSRVGLTQGTGANVSVRAESRPAGLKAQQAKKPTVGAGDSRPPTPGCGHRPARFGKAGPGRHRAAFESSQRRSGSIKSLALGDVITFYDSLQVPGRADD